MISKIVNDNQSKKNTKKIRFHNKCKRIEKIDFKLLRKFFRN